jgi:hypothetical protein
MSLVKKLAVKLSEPHPKSRFFSYLSPLSAFVLVIAVFSSAIFAISTLSSPEAVAATKRQAITKYEFTMPKAYQPQGSNGGYDDYRCFLMDPKINLNSILTTIEFVPQVKEIVHHAILFRIPAKQVAQAKALDVNGDGWSCFGGSGIGSMFQSFVNTPWLSAWVLLLKLFCNLFPI